MPSPLSHIQGFLVDLDGTTTIGDTALPGAVRFFQTLRDRNLPFLFFSNNPTKHIKEYVEHLATVGIPATADQIITSTQATINHLQQHNCTSVYTIGTPGFEQELADAGIRKVVENPQAVVISFDTTLTYEKLQTASSLLMNNPHLPYIATNPDLLCPTPVGPIPDCGALIAFFKAATGREPQVMGKPYKGMIDIAAQRLNLPPGALALIGDRLYTDIRMAKQHGLTAVLVLSGETNQEDIAGSPDQPDIVVENLEELITHLP